MFDALFVPVELRASTSDEAWLQAMLDAERALASASAAAGVTPREAARSIADACRAERFDLESLLDRGRSPGNPVEPLVRDLAAAVGEPAGRYVHRGATSQDILDTAAMLVTRRALSLILDELDGVAGECAALASEHRTAVMPGRTLLQQAVPTTFGLKAAGWLTGALDARRALAAIRTSSLAAQLGGAAGTLSAFGDSGLEVLRLYAAELDLHEPVMPWHANRVRVGELGAALAVAAGAVAKIGLDLALLGQTEVGEVAEADAGGSSTMPGKRNPVGSALALACARHAAAEAAVLVASLPHEHERALGGWHAEWAALTGALRWTGGAAAAVRRSLSGLRVDAARMRANLELSGGAAHAERLAFLLTGSLGRAASLEVVSAAVEAARSGGRPLRELLRDDPRVELSPSELDAALDPSTYLGSADRLIDRALEAYRAESRAAT